MDFEYRLKGSITETIVKAIFTDDGYRVIDSGIEHLVREVTCLSQKGYLDLSFSKGLRNLPDLIILNKLQTKAHLVEVKYKQKWNDLLIRETEEQVKYFKEITLVCVNGSPETSSTEISGATHLRAMQLKYENDLYQARKYKSSGSDKVGIFEWITIAADTRIDWWDLAPMQFVFDEMTSSCHPKDHPKHGENINTLLACRAISSLMDTNIWNTSS